MPTVPARHPQHRLQICAPISKVYRQLLHQGLIAVLTVSAQRLPVAGEEVEVAAEEAAQPSYLPVVVVEVVAAGEEVRESCRFSLRIRQYSRRVRVSWSSGSRI